MARMRLRRVGVLAVAFWHGLYSLFFALFVGFAYSAYTYAMYGRLPAATLQYYTVVVPLITCPLGAGAYGLAALIYNSVAARMGGIPLELSGEEYDAPPPPSYT